MGSVPSPLHRGKALGHAQRVHLWVPSLCLVSPQEAREPILLDPSPFNSFHHVLSLFVLLIKDREHAFPAVLGLNPSRVHHDTLVELFRHKTRSRWNSSRFLSDLAVRADVVPGSFQDIGRLVQTLTCSALASEDFPSLLLQLAYLACLGHISASFCASPLPAQPACFTIFLNTGAFSFLSPRQR